VVENVNIPDLAINYRSPESLVGYAQNARTHTDAQIDQIANSIRNFGWTNPILVDSNNGVIAGHGRVLAARKLGLTRVPVIALAHLTLDQKRAYIAPKLADISDKVLFGDVWERPELSPRDRSMITVASLISLYRVNELPFHLKKRSKMA
jgi:alkylhydroperoxidase/carboxymuconolactone decarboxylase family protein YurZ